MQLPLPLAASLKHLVGIKNEDELLGMLNQNSNNLKNFIENILEDTTWCDNHQKLVTEILDLLTKKSFNFKDRKLLQPIIPLLQKKADYFNAFLPLDITVKTTHQSYLFNSLLLASLSFFLNKWIYDELPLQEAMVLNLPDLSDREALLWQELCNYGEIKELWRFSEEQLWEIIDESLQYEVLPLMELSEMILKRYLDNTNVIQFLRLAKDKKLALLQQQCIEFLNQTNQGFLLHFYQADYLVFEFLNFREKALYFFDLLKDKITHLIFSEDLSSFNKFNEILLSCKNLISLNLSDTKQPPQEIITFPKNLKELILARCFWLKKEHLILFARSCPHIYSLDISSNGHLQYDIWRQLQGFSNLLILNISRCYAIGDREFSSIIESAKLLIDLKMESLEKLSQEAFFEIGKLSDLAFLNISRTAIDDANLIAIMTNCRHLQDLSLERCQNISEKGLLEGVKNAVFLSKLNLKGSNFSHSSIDKILPIRPAVTIDI